MSNIELTDEAFDTFLQMKTRKLKKDGKLCKYMVMQIKDKKEIVIADGENMIGYDTGDNSQTWENFMEALDSVGDCCYGVFDFAAKLDGRLVEKLILIKLVPDTASIMSKFPYGSSFEGLKSKIEPHKCIQASEMGDLTEEEVMKVIQK